MLSLIRKRMRGEKGFTLIELLVVIIIIAILAAIAIPTFLGQRQKAQDAAAKSLLRNAMTAMESSYVDIRAFDLVTADDLEAIEPSIEWTGGQDAQLNQVAWEGTAPEIYHMETTSQSGKTFLVDVDKGSGGGTVWSVEDGGTTVTSTPPTT
jgi:type IV pilus assembly protein PilA